MKETYRISPQRLPHLGRTIQVKDRAQAIKWATALYGTQKMSIIKLK